MKRISDKKYNEFRSYFPFTCVDLLIFQNNEILLTKRTINPFKGFWHLPGTIIRRNENMKDAVKRAAKKELNTEIKIIKYLGVYESRNRFRHDISHGYLVDIIKGKIKTDFQSDEFRFYKNFPKKIVPHHKEMIKDAKKLQECNKFN